MVVPCGPVLRQDLSGLDLAAELLQTPKSRAGRADATSMSATTTKQSVKSTAAKTSAPAAQQDRRRSARQSRELPAWLSDQSGGRRPQQQRVSVTDMSLHGCGFIASEKLEIGASHWIVVAAENLHVSTRLRVINLREREDGSFDVGAEFF